MSCYFYELNLTKTSCLGLKTTMTLIPLSSFIVMSSVLDVCVGQGSSNMSLQSIWGRFFISFQDPESRTPSSDIDFYS